MDLDVLRRLRPASCILSSSVSPDYFWEIGAGAGIYIHTRIHTHHAIPYHTRLGQSISRPSVDPLEWIGLDWNGLE